MHVEIFTLCDAATEAGGKLNILGSFDTLYCNEAPIVHPQCALAMKIRFSKSEEGEHKLKVHFADSEGKPVLQDMEATIRVKAGPYGTVTSNVILNIHALRLERFGNYSIELSVNDRSEALVPLYAVQTPKREQPAL